MQLVGTFLNFASQVVDQITEHYLVASTLAFLILYGLYKWAIGYAVVYMKGDYNTKKKNIGKTIPTFANGWYIVCRSHELTSNNTKAVDIAGHNIVVARNKQGQAHALYAYCKHMGAHLGVGGEVVNGSCLQCPFHGWLYNLETGQLVDHDNKPLKLNSIEYADGFGSKEVRTPEWKQTRDIPTLRKYPVKELNTFIYVWIHSDPTVQPYFMMADGSEFCKSYSNMGQTIHDINVHMQDIPQNGADTFHFRYVHRYLIGKYKMLEVSWRPSWKRGDDPQIAQIFQHPIKSVKQFKQRIYEQMIKPLPNKQYYSFGSVDNYVILPLLGPTFFFNITIVQYGPSLVNVFLKTRFFQVVFFQYLQPQQKYKQKLYHEMFATPWLPHWLCYIMLYAQGMQVYYDMLVWDAKKFGHKIYLKDNQADRFIKSWREWFSQHYDGCGQKVDHETGSLQF